MIKTGALVNESPSVYQNGNPLTRETILCTILEEIPEGIFVSTTGKTSRELFEIRERNGQGHERDFLTVGSMGHSSSIALGIAMHRPKERVVCLDGDGAALMHLGAMATIGSREDLGRPTQSPKENMAGFISRPIRCREAS